LEAKLVGVIQATDITKRDWRAHWVETNSLLTAKAFSYSSLVPWKLRKQWNNALESIGYTI